MRGILGWSLLLLSLFCFAPAFAADTAVAKQLAQPCITQEEEAKLKGLLSFELDAAITDALRKALETGSDIDRCRAQTIKGIAIDRAKLPLVRVSTNSDLPDWAKKTADQQKSSRIERYQVGEKLYFLFAPPHGTADFPYRLYDVNGNYLCSPWGGWSSDCHKDLTEKLMKTKPSVTWGSSVIWRELAD